MHRLACAALASSVLWACGSGSDAILERTDPGEAVPGSAQIDAAAPLPKGIFPLPAIDDKLDDGSLSPLKAIVGDAWVVGLGDSAQASDGFSRAKARLSQFLVAQMDFRVVAFQANRSEIAYAMRYVAECGEPSTVGAADSASVRNLLAWMCDWNRLHAADPVSIVGFDVDQPEADDRSIRAGVARAAAGDAQGLLAKLGECEHFTSSFDPCRDALDGIEMYLVRNAAAVAQRSTEAERAELRVAMTSYRGGRASSFYAGSDPDRGADARQEAMASVLKALTGGAKPPAKVVVWATGNDLAALRDKVTESVLPGTTTMGSALRGDLGGRYQAIDLLGWDIEVDSPGIGYVRAPKPSAASLEMRLHALNEPYLLVDLEAAGVIPFLGADHYELGAPAKETLVPREQFRALLYLDESR